MSQRTRARTTGAAARPIDRAAPTDGPASEREAPQSPSETREASRRGKRGAASATPSAPAADETAAGLPLQPEALARALRAVATELERDPALAQRVAQAMNTAPAADAGADAALEPAPRVRASRESRRVSDAEPDAEPAPPTIGRSFHPTIITGVAEALGPGVPDPFALRERLGEEGMREALASLRLGSLRAIIRQHGLDATGGLTKLNDAEKLRAHILAATRKGRK